MSCTARSIVGLSLLFLTAIAPAGAASFDCAKAKLPDEKAVCADRTLNDKDVRLALLYQLIRKAQGGMGALGAILDEQTQWLTERNACAGDIKCLNGVYDQRIKVLRSGVDAALVKSAQ